MVHSFQVSGVRIPHFYDVAPIVPTRATDDGTNNAPAPAAETMTIDAPLFEKGKRGLATSLMTVFPHETAAFVHKQSPCDTMPVKYKENPIGRTVASKEDTMSLDRVIDAAMRSYDHSTSLALLRTLALPEQGGLGYSLQFFDPAVDLDGWEVDHTAKVIKLDRSGIFSDYSPNELAQTLKACLETEILKTRAPLAEQVGWGTGKVLLGVVETTVGLIGILVPEPGTTAAGIVVFALGVNSVADGFSQLAGANRGHGYNILGEGVGAAGAQLADLAGADRELGRAVGRGAFTISAIALGSWGSIRVLRIPRQAFLKWGVGLEPGGATVGRLQLLYASENAKDGMTIININNNAGKSILRFVTHDGRLLANGRIYGQQRVLRHEGSAREIIKGILKLLVHGAKH